ncbi:DEAD-box ATP-dependent RNA helicase 42-like isoform X11 [Triticum dicoccoides]|uniref:DEAD-box ATP-dependent RNA helicase 42-like isoform X11 n=1 Tax=Triticum dicoccoides TaxID=85692 RepID=UPI00188E5484|nr:DEAD-box ATP-dependent RNA helicase 42-like isoform X11 [Triticum dicoccoides]
MVRSRSPKGEDDGRRRSTPRRSSDEQGGRKEKGPISLLVRNIPHNCRYEDLQVPFAKFGPVRDIYMPKDYYSGEPKGFAFIEFFDSHDASEAQYHMNCKLFCGREIKVEPATDKRKRPEDMRRRTGVRVHSGSKGRDLSRHGRSRSRSHSRSPRQGGRDRSRSQSPASRRRGDYSASPKRKEECQAKSSGQSKEYDNDKKLGSCTPGGRSECHDTDNDSNERRATRDYSAAPKRKEACQTKSPRQTNEHDEDKKRISFSPDRNNRRDADNGHNERDDYSTSSKRKGERLSKSLRLSKEHDKDKKRRSYSRDDRSDCRDADNSFKERRATTDDKRSCPRQRSPRPSSGSHSRRRDAYSASPKGKEERREQSPRQSKEHDKHRKQRSNTPDDRNDCHGADHSHNEMQGDCSTSPKIKEERQAKSSRESEEYNKDTKGRSCAPHDRNDRHDAVNGSRDSNLHVDRKPVTPDDEGSHACRRSPRPSSGSRSRKRDDCSASPKKKEECRAKSPKQSIEYKDEKRRSCTSDDINGRHNAVNCYKKKRDGYSASPKIKEECRAESPRPTKEREDNDGIDRTDADNGYNERRAGPDSASQKRMEKPPQAKSQSQSKEYDNGKKNGSCTHDDGKECRDADNGSKERKDYSAAGKRKEERLASLPRQSKEHDEHKKRGSYTRDDRNDLRDADNGSKERRKDYSAAGKRKEERQASLPRQSKEHDEHKKRGCYTRDDRNDLCDADNGSKERNDYSTSRKRMEDYMAKSSRQSKEHDDDKKRGSYTPDDRSHRSNADNGSRERRGDFSASGRRKEEYRGKSPRQLKEHGDNKKRGSYTPADRNDLRDVNNGCNEKLATHDGSRSPCPGRRSPRPS